jgi:hypothetical protein
VRPRRRRRFWRALFWICTSFAMLLAAAPYAINLPWVRRQVADALTEEMGTTVRIDGLGFSWFSGIEARGVEIDNARGFDPAHPCLELAELRGDLRWPSLLRGRVDFAGTITGLRVRIDQDEQGRTNFEQLSAHGDARGTRARVRGSDRSHPRSPRSRDDGEFDLQQVRIDLAVAGALIEIRRGGRLVESVHDLDCTVRKDFGAEQVTVRLDGKLAALTAGAREGSLHLRADANANARTADFALETQGLDLARYQPLAQALQPGAVTALAGIVNGTCTGKLRFTDPPSIELGGELAVEHPHLAGALLQGMDLQAERWTLRPALAVGTGGLPRLDPAFAIDLGFLQLRPLDAARLRQLLAGRPGLGVDCALDLDALVRAGGTPAGHLRGASGRLAGAVALPTPGGALPKPADLARALVADLRVDGGRVAFAGFEVTQLAGTVALRDGHLAAATAAPTQLNDGPLALQLQGDLRDADSQPLTIALDWKGGKVAGEAVQVLRYAVPLLAGLDAKVADFAAGADLTLQLTGPFRRRDGENWAQVLNRWAGNGTVELRNGRVTPAPALRGLLAPLGDLLGPGATLGDDGRLLLDVVSSRFRIANGWIESKAMRWLSKGRELGLEGRVGLDGALDFGLDLSPLLAAHKDGAKALAALGKQPLRAGLHGSLDAPKLSLPEVRAAIESALQQEAGKLLQKGVDALLKDKKKQ